MKEAEFRVPMVRPQGLGEEIANAVSHGVGSLLAIAGLVLLIVKAAASGNNVAVASVSLYGASMIVLYLISCLYHALTAPRGKRVFRVLDHCSIFLMILGSYIPITLVLIGGTLGWELFGIVTALAVLGIVLNAVSFNRWNKLSMVLYLLMGWLVVLSLRPLLQRVPVEGLILLVAGGLAYTLGTIFYKMKSRPYMHFVWHLFVLAGSVLHFFAIYQNCCIPM